MKTDQLTSFSFWAVLIIIALSISDLTDAVNKIATSLSNIDTKMTKINTEYVEEEDVELNKEQL